MVSLLLSAWRLLVVQSAKEIRKKRHIYGKENIRFRNVELEENLEHRVAILSRKLSM